MVQFNNHTKHERIIKSKTRHIQNEKREENKNKKTIDLKWKRRGWGSRQQFQHWTVNASFENERRKRHKKNELKWGSKSKCNVLRNPVRNFPMPCFHVLFE